jgi:DNA-binding CsgD family transcriptional regulator
MVSGAVSNQERRGLERFPAKWTPVRVKKTRQNKNLEPRSDSIGTEEALVRCLNEPDGKFLAGFPVSLARNARAARWPMEAFCCLMLTSFAARHCRRPQMLTTSLFEALSDVEEDCAAHAVLDQLSAGVALLDRDLKVQFTNKAFRAIASGGVLIRRGNSLSCSSPLHAGELDQLIRSALTGGPGGSMAIPHPDDGRLIPILVTPVRSRNAFADLHRRNSTVTLFIFDPGRPLALPPKWIMDAYHLTMAEARVALESSAGRSVSEIGLRLNITPNTVKSHLRKIFPKTGVRGRAELAGLLTALGSVRCEVNLTGRDSVEPNDRRASSRDRGSDYVTR